MALNHFFDGFVPETDFFEDTPSIEKLESSGDAIEGSERNSSSFDCNICLECVQDPVVTFCGHLYCWPCIYKWIYLQSTSSKEGEKQKPQCPVCKSDVSQSSVVPLYGRGEAARRSEGKSNQPGMAIPKRPTGPRSYNNAAADYSEITSHQTHPEYTSNEIDPEYTSHQTHPEYTSEYTSHQTHGPQQFNSTPGHYTSPMSSTSGPTDRTTYGEFGEMIYARVFGNQLTNIYTYSNSYTFTGTGNPRIRRNLMHADTSLGRISVFLLCCVIMCLLVF